jgi:biotin carboxyl carrier protein
MARRSFGIILDGDERSLKLDDFQPPGEDGLGHIAAEIDGRRLEANFRILAANRIQLLQDDRSSDVLLAETTGIRHLAVCGAHAACQANRTRRSGGPKRAKGPDVCPPMPSVVVRLLVEPGQTVKAGEALVVVSAMKMESTLTAPFDGVVEAVLAADGDKVGPKDTLVRMRPQEENQ